MNVSSLPPLCIDLDGTLIHTDVTQESLRLFLKKKPYAVGKVFFWLLRGRAFLKKKLAENTDLDVARLPFNKVVLDLVQEAQKNKQRIVLATAADEKIAREVALYCGFFEDVIASDGRVNQRAHQKAVTLIKLYGYQNFIYIGNSKDDLKVWKYAEKGIAVNVPAGVVKKLKEMNLPVEILTHKKPYFKASS